MATTKGLKYGAGLVVAAAVIVAVFLVTGFHVAGARHDDKRCFRIGIVTYSASLDEVIAGFKAGMSARGYVEGETITYVQEGPTESIDALVPAVEKIKEKKVDLVLSVSTPAALKAKKAFEGTGTPVLFGPTYDPVQSGLVADLSKTGDCTGVMVGNFVPRQVEWLVAVAPNAKRVLATYHPKDNSAMNCLAELRKMAETMKLTLVEQETRSMEDLDKVAASISDRTDIDAVIVIADNLSLTRAGDICRAARARKLPTSSVSVKQAREDALVMYGIDFIRIGEQNSRIADQILKRGTTGPANVPVELADNFLTINLKVAADIGLEVPDHVLQSADRIIR